MKVQIKVLDKSAARYAARPPTRGTSMSAGYDLIACVDEKIVVRYGDKAQLVPTGLAIFIDSPNVAAVIMPRSGLGHKQGLVLGNTVGLIDGDYQNEWFVSVSNRGNGRDEEGDFPDIVIEPGDRIAQVVFLPVIHPEFVEVGEFEYGTDRGLGGFGSTGA